MADFNIQDFTTILQEFITISIPIEPEWLAQKKHGNLKENQRHPLHLKEQVEKEFKSNLTKYNDNLSSFNLGSERLEEIYPYYHILEDSEVIHKRGKGTKTSKGSQANVKDKGKRDYGKVTANIRFVEGTPKVTYYQEYRKNVRGKRSALRKQTFQAYDMKTGKTTYYERVVGTKTNTTYVNRNYHYIENNIESWIIPTLMSTFNLKRKRNVETDILDGNENDLKGLFNL